MQNLVCKICFERFDHSKHKPHVLIFCTHTFCINCINKLSKDQNGFKCPTCNSLIEETNPNWALLDSVQESLYDKNKKNLEKALIETEKMRAELKTNREVELKERKDKMKSLRTDIKSKSGEAVKAIHQCQRRLIIKSKNIEASLKKKYNNLVLYEKNHIVKRVEDAKNNLDENQLSKFTSDFNEKRLAFAYQLQLAKSANLDYKLETINLNNFADIIENKSSIPNVKNNKPKVESTTAKVELVKYSEVN